jgi:hypothetical protein
MLGTLPAGWIGRLFPLGTENSRRRGPGEEPNAGRSAGAAAAFARSRGDGMVVQVIENNFYYYLFDRFRNLA